jgi:hypothetical protein
MSNWPRAVGDHLVTDEWVCEHCGADYDCLSQFRTTDCE